MKPEVKARYAEGEVLAGRYRVDGIIGRGGMAEVYRVADVRDGGSWALKLLRTELATTDEAVQRLRREGQILQRLNHPAIVAMAGDGTLPDGSLYMLMELLTGETLGERIRREKRLTPAALVPIVAGVCAALHAAHDAGVVHRDLKPDNIFLTHAGAIKLLDFGVSKLRGSNLTATGEVLGTPRYMSPEQLTAEPDIDGRADVYALGVILFEALSGRPPFIGPAPADVIVAVLRGDAPRLRQVRADLPEAVEKVVSRAMAVKRDTRFDSTAALGDAYIAVARTSAPAAAPAAQPGAPTLPLGSLPTPVPAPQAPESLPPATWGDREAPAAGRSGETPPTPHGRDDSLDTGELALVTGAARSWLWWALAALITVALLWFVVSG